MDFVLFGSGGVQSLVTLRELARWRCLPAAIVIAQQQVHPIAGQLGGIALETAPVSSAFERLAVSLGIEVIDADDVALVRVIQALAPALLLVSCYPRRLGENLLALPRSGCFNIHPSALPDYRGPSPIFWQLRDGLARLGVTMHVMTEALDRGPVVAIHHVDGDVNWSYEQWVEALTRVAVKAFSDQFVQLCAGDFSAVPQAGPGSQQGWPTEKDFAIDVNWSAHRISRFVNGTAALGRTWVELGTEGVFAITDARPLADATACNSRGPGSGSYTLNCEDGTLALMLDSYL